MENNVIGKVGFRFSSRFSQLIGRNLISNPIVSVSELVKNAYDADADNISIEFKNLLTGSATLTIIDDGEGMTFEDVSTKWMMVGTDNKVHTPFTPKGRRKLGEKGIGRFSVERLAKRLQIVSSQLGDDFAISFSIDWDEYENFEGEFSDCDSCTSKACKDNVNRFIDSLVEDPSEYMYLAEDTLLYAYSTSKPADYTIKYLRLNRKQLVKLRYVRRFMDSWLDELNVKKEKAISDIAELKKRQQEITVVLEQRYNDKNHPYRNVVSTMAEMLVLQAEQSLVLIEDEIQRINHILLQRRGSDEALKT